MTPTAAVAAVAALVLLPAPPPAPSSADRTGCLRLLDGATAAVERAVEDFEAHRSGETGARLRAERVLVAATGARDRLEAAAAPAGCAPSRGEELIYLNHLIPGFRGWLAARSRRPPAEYDVASIIRRARIHRERGRERLR